ncbi:radical SAM protein [Anaerobacterium chartisolvens]|nr:radical SAM protein [Anaerobacterium chartisolvens]
MIEVELTKEEIEELSQKGLISKIQQIGDQRYLIKRLRTLDIEIASDYAIDTMNSLKSRYDEGHYTKKDGSYDIDALKMDFASIYRTTCTQRCPHCFNQEDDFYIQKIIKGQKLMKWSETLALLKQAKRFGLESVKFLGIGEIFSNAQLFNILDDIRNEGLIIAIFTKGTALGDDETAKNCNYKGIETAEDLVERISQYHNVSILLGANSFVPDFQDTMVGCGKDGGVKDYTYKRNRALKLLIKHKFNDPQYGKRLALIAAPVTPKVSDETVEMYEWAIKRNMPVVTIPTMVSGKGSGELEWLLGQFEYDETLIKRYDPQKVLTREQRYTQWLIDFYSDIYVKALQLGIYDMDTLNNEGLSGYAGAAKCQQSHNGMYIRLPGSVQECPGRCIGAEIIEDLREQSLLATWIGSINHDRTVNCRALCSVKMKDLTNSNVHVCDCCRVYDNVGSMPLELEQKVLENLNTMLYCNFKTVGGY